MSRKKHRYYEFLPVDKCDMPDIVQENKPIDGNNMDEWIYGYKYIFNNDHTIMLLIDPKTGYLRDANPAACSYYGYSRNEMLKLKLNDLNMMPKEELFKTIKKITSKERKYYKIKHRLANGEIKDVEIYSGPVKIGNEELIFSIIHDVQEKSELIRKLSLQETYFRELFENSPEAIAFVDNEFKIINTNRSFTAIFGYENHEVLGSNITEVLCERELYDESKYFKEGINKGEFIRKDTVRKRKDGNLVDVSLLAYPVFSEGEQAGIFCIYSDVTRAKETERYKNLYSEVFKNSPVGIAITTSIGELQWINESFTKITGYTIDDVKGKKPNVLKSGVHKQKYYEDMWESILTNGQWKGEIYNKRKNGEIYLEWLTIIAIRDDNGNITHFIGMFNYITDEKNKDEEIIKLTYMDVLTHLYNRYYFRNRLNDEINKISKNSLDEKFAVLFIDINDFKEINDTLGHLMGDRVLQSFSKRIIESVRKNDVVARFGGDEFIIMLQNIKNHDSALEIANRILDSIKTPIVIDYNKLYITASIGITLYPKDGEDYTTLVRHADIAMYRAKEFGGNKVIVFDKSLNLKVKENFWIRNNLRNAIDRDELILHYQPIFDTNTSRIVGVEALLRWKTARGKLIEPTKFIPIAEKSGMIHSMGEWVLRRACEQNKKWQDLGLRHIFMSVNVSVVQLEDGDFAEIVEEALKATGLDPEYLQLEMTETVLGINHERIIRNIDRLSKLKIKISIDDFGTGYSSLGQLKKFNISKLKIDKSFINELEKKGNNAKIVKAIIAMSKNLKLKLVAEGVETVEQLNFLRRNKCDMVQGYLFSRPVDPKSMEKILSDIE